MSINKAPAIWVPSRRPIVLNGNVSGRMEGRYKFTVRRPDGEVRLETGWSKNLITNTGMDNFAKTSDWDRYCYVGTGNTAPANTDTSLTTPVVGGVTDTTTGPDTRDHVFDGTEGYHRLIRTFRFDIGDAEGVLAEVGVGPTASTLTSRSLITDGGGTPTTITVLSDEILDVTYEFRVWHGQDTATTSTITLDSVLYNTTLRWLQVASTPDPGVTNIWDVRRTGATPGVGARDTTPPTNWTDNWTGASSPAETATKAAYVDGNHYQDFACVWDYTRANYTDGIKGIYFSHDWNLASMAFENDADNTKGILKDNTQELTLNWRWSWARKA